MNTKSKGNCKFDFKKMSQGVQCFRCSEKPCGKNCPYATPLLKQDWEAHTQEGFALLDPRGNHIDWFDDNGRFMIYVSERSAEEQQARRPDRKIVKVIIRQELSNLKEK